MAVASHLSGSGKVGAWRARSCGITHALAVSPILVMLLAPATVRGDIYKWTDEHGNTVISNIQPAGSSKVSGVELLAAASAPAAPSPGTVSQSADARTQQVLEARIENLERQLEAQQPQAVSQPGYSADYYAAPAPPPDPSYYSGYDPGYYPSYYPAYYYPALPVYSFVSVPARPRVRRPAFVSRPVFVSRPPVFVGRPPVFVSRPPVFVSQPAVGVTHRTSFGGGAMHRGRR